MGASVFFCVFLRWSVFFMCFFKVVCAFPKWSVYFLCFFKGVCFKPPLDRSLSMATKNPKCKSWGVGDFFLISLAQTIQCGLFPLMQTKIKKGVQARSPTMDVKSIVPAVLPMTFQGRLFKKCSREVQKRFQNGPTNDPQNETEVDI